MIADGRTLAASKAFSVPELTKRMEIGFSALVLGTPEKFRYRYRLLGADPSWVETIGHDSTTYTNLAPGHYGFEIAAADESGLWSETTRIDVTIARAWYQAYWFYAVCFIALVALMWALHHLRLRQAARRLRVEMNAKQAERERIARELHDTLLQTIYAALMRFGSISQRLPHRDGVRRQMELELDHLERLVEETRNRVTSVRSGEVSISRWADELSDYGASLSNAYAIALSVELNGDLGSLDLGAADDLTGIVREAIANACRHSGGQHVNVLVDRREDRLVVSVIDDGIGFDGMREPQPGDGEHESHWGLVGMKERARRLGADFSIEQSSGGGTCVEVVLRRAD